MASELESDLRDTLNWGRKWLLEADFDAGKTRLVSFDRSNNTGTIDVKIDGSVLEEKLFFKMLVLSISSKFFSSEVALYLHKSTIWLRMEYCVMCWLVFLAATWNC